MGNFDVVSIPRSEQGDDLSGLLADCGSAEVEAQADESYELIAFRGIARYLLTLRMSATISFPS